MSEMSAAERRKRMQDPCPRCGYNPNARVRRSWEFVIERDTPSLNARVVNAGPSRFAYAKERDIWCMEFRVKRVNLQIPGARPMERDLRITPGIPGTVFVNVHMPATPPRRVTLRRVYGGRQRERDKDNLIGGMKVVVDAMVMENLIADDSAARAEIHYQQLLDNRPRTTREYVKRGRSGEGMARIGLHVTIEDLA